MEGQSKQQESNNLHSSREEREFQKYQKLKRKFQVLREEYLKVLENWEDSNIRVKSLSKEKKFLREKLEYFLTSTNVSDETLTAAIFEKHNDLAQEKQINNQQQTQVQTAKQQQNNVNQQSSSQNLNSKNNAQMDQGVPSSQAMNGNQHHQSQNGQNSLSTQAQNQNVTQQNQNQQNQHAKNSQLQQQQQYSAPQAHQQQQNGQGISNQHFNSAASAPIQGQPTQTASKNQIQVNSRSSAVNDNQANLHTQNQQKQQFQVQNQQTTGGSNMIHLQAYNTTTTQIQQQAAAPKQKRQKKDHSHQVVTNQQNINYAGYAQPIFGTMDASGKHHSSNGSLHSDSRGSQQNQFQTSSSQVPHNQNGQPTQIFQTATHSLTQQTQPQPVFQAVQQSQFVASYSDNLQQQQQRVVTQDQQIFGTNQLQTGNPNQSATAQFQHQQHQITQSQNIVGGAAYVQKQVNAQQTAQFVTSHAQQNVGSYSKPSSSNQLSQQQYANGAVANLHTGGSSINQNQQQQQFPIPQFTIQHHAQTQNQAYQQQNQ
eukprot:403349745